MLTKKIITFQYQSNKSKSEIENESSTSTSTQAIENNASLANQSNQNVVADIDQNNAHEINAVKAIQGVFRGGVARTNVDISREESLNQKASLLMADPSGEYLSIAAEMLQNTLFNLVQEAVHEEFAINSEPLTLLLKKK